MLTKEINLTEKNLQTLADLLQRMSTEDMMEDLMLMYSAYVTHATDPELYELDASMAFDLQRKLFTVQTILQIVMTIDKPSFKLQKGGVSCN